MAALMKFSRGLSPFMLNSVKSRYLGRSNNINKIRHFCLFRSLDIEKKFSEAHEWIVVEGNVGKIGISDYAQDKLGDIVYVQLPEDGNDVEKDEECGALESVKAASEIFTPVSGKVVGTNTVVEEKPALINQSCYDEGWLFKIQLSKPAEVDDLMSEAEYEKFLKSQDED